MTVYFYENWQAEQKAKLHLGTCGCCNDGTGTGRGTLGEENGRWHGPFGTLDEARLAAQATGRPISECPCINR